MLTLVSAVLLSGCQIEDFVSVDVDEEIPTEIVILSPADWIGTQGEGRPLLIGEALAFDAEVRTGRGRVVEDPDIEWSSSDPEVAVVDLSGEVTAVGVGTAQIEASHADLSATVAVEVLAIASLELTPSSATLLEGETLTLEATAVATNGEPVDASRLEWESSDTSIARVEGGTVYARHAGTVSVAVEVGERRAESAIEVAEEEEGDSGDDTGDGDDSGGTAPERSVKFYVDASSGFDPWTRSPSVEQQAWMREHYFRMQTYSPYFDSRLAWYPNAWVYRDSYAVYRDSDLPEENPEWVLRDTNGNALYIPYGCSGGTCPQYAGDFGNPEFRRRWIDRLGETLAEGYAGVWVDDVNMDWRVSDGNGDHVKPVDPRTGVEMTLADWRRYFAEFMEEIRAAFPNIEIAHNVIWYAQPPNDPFIQRQMRAADFINLERGATDSGIRGGSGTYGYETFLGYIDGVHDMGGHAILDDDDSETDVEWMYELATYFLVKSGDDMVAADGDRSRMNPDNFWEGYDVELGDALGARYTAGGLLRRDYRCGSVVLNQPDQPTRTLALGEDLIVLGGGLVSSVTLAGYTAAVLLRETCTP